MRKIVAFIFITFATATSFAQEIKGIGDFKIGMSLEEFLDLPLIKAKTLQDKASQKNSIKESDLWKTTADSKVSGYDRVYSASVVKFEFLAPLGVPTHYDHRYGGDIYEVTTKFYEGKLALAKVSAPGVDFEKILTEKYGQPNKEKVPELVSCQNGYGAISSHFNGVQATIWGKGKKISATLSFFHYGCGEVVRWYTVEETTIVKAINRIDENGSKAAAAEEAKVKAGASKL
jgi:hypothetical protein